MTPRSAPILTKTEWCNSLGEQWLSTRNSTEDITRGSGNENAVVKFIENFPCIETIVELGLVCNREELLYAETTDGLEEVNTYMLTGATNWKSKREVTTAEVVKCLFSTVQIKSRITVASRIEVGTFRRVEPYVRVWDSAEVQRIVPNNLGKMIHQCNVMGLNMEMYVCATETCVLYILLVLVSDQLLRNASSALSPSMKD